MSGVTELGLCGQIRQLIAAAPRGMSCGEVQARFPGENIPVALGSMYRSGQLVRTGEYRDYRYWIGRPVRSRERNLTAEERRAKRNAGDRRRYAAMSPEQRTAYLEPRYAKRAQQPAKPAAARADRAAPAGPPIVIPPTVLYAAPKPQQVPFETVESWMARTGQRPERIAGFEQVRPHTRQPVRSF